MVLGIEHKDEVIIPALTFASVARMNVYWLYSILVDDKSYGIDRDELMEELAKNGVETRRFFYPIHFMPPYKKYAADCQFPVTEKLSSRGINLPSSVKLTEEEIYKVAQLVNRFYRE